MSKNDSAGTLEFQRANFSKKKNKWKVLNMANSAMEAQEGRGGLAPTHT
jgi:hypothetical protein